MSATVLDRIVAETRAEVQRRKREQPLPEPQAQAGGRFADALRAPGIGVIAEFKRRSPSAGVLAARPQLEQVVDAYTRGGAVALSILTERANFDGALEDLHAARAASSLPVLRKDFIVDRYQLHEALLARADAVLLIVAALDDGELRELHRAAIELGLDVLVEVHDERELERALELSPQIVGVNNRDLRDFSVDLARTERLVSEMPGDVITVSESGIGAPEQLQTLESLGIHAVLVGERLMRSSDPAAELRRLLGAL